MELKVPSRKCQVTISLQTERPVRGQGLQGHYLSQSFLLPQQVQGNGGSPEVVWTAGTRAGAPGDVNGGNPGGSPRWCEHWALGQDPQIAWTAGTREEPQVA